MKKYLIILQLFFTFLSFSQTKSERLSISNSYSKTNSDKLIKELDIENYAREKKINDYIVSHPGYLKKYSSGNKKFKAINVIDDKLIYMSTHNEEAALSSRTNFLNSGGALYLDLNGEDMIVGVWDGGSVLDTHQEFYNRNTGSRIDNIDATSTSDTDDHATHVAGTIAASGSNARAKGMAPKSVIYSYDWDNDSSELANAAANGLLVSNHSYGVSIEQDGFLLNANQIGTYSSSSRSWDLILNNYPYLMSVISAGNDGQVSYTNASYSGFDKLVGNKVSKNALVVGNARDAVINPSNGDLLSVFINPSSSQGPTDDGRIKPDLVGNGSDVYSPINSSDASYATYSGTSMAAPNVSGSLILLQQYFNQLNGKFMKSASIKALVCHTADDDALTTGPDAVFGWGMLNTKAAAEAIKDATESLSIIEELRLNNGESKSYQLYASNNGPIKATISWNDPAGNSQNNALNSTTPALVNNLDLRVVYEDGTNFFPWKLNEDNYISPAIKGDNNVDNIEIVEIEFPYPGNYEVIISHKNQIINNNQDFTLIVTGSDLVLSNESKQTVPFSIYPNPSKNLFNLSFGKNLMNAFLDCYDINGKLLFSKVYNDLKTTQLDMSKYASGVYTVKVRSSKGIVSKKLVKL